VSTSAVAARPGGFMWKRWIKRNGWTVGVWALLALSVAWYATLIPRFGTFEVTTILKSGLPLALLALAQGVIVLSGGVDLSIGSMLVLANVTSARFMEGQDFTTTLIIAVVVLVAAAVLDAVVGWIISVSRVPDIVVTLATSFVFAGLALWILPSPGGGTSGGFRILFTGSEFGIGRVWWPSLVMLAVPTAAVWAIMRRTRTGLSLYAIGSSRDAAFLSGLNVKRSRIVAYALGGFLAALAGLATTAITGGGEPRYSIGANATLNSVAAVVLGGIALTGGIGSPLGAVAAAYALYMLAPILTGLGVDPNQAQVIQGVLIVLVMMGAGLIELRRRRTV
jgi:ribose transport system permease protein